MTSNISSAAPPRGTRPRNRRELIREAAAGLFAERGYGQVSLGDVAEAVNVGSSAIYRHYSGKAELLYDVVDSALDRVAAVPAEVEGADLSETIGALVVNVLENRLVGVLWQRESRHLPAPERAKLGKKVSLVNYWLSSELQTRRPELDPDQAELLANCAVDAATSISFHHLMLPRATFQALLTDLCLRVVLLEPRHDSEPTTRRSPRRASSRRDELIDASVRLFAREGFPSVTIDDIGAAVGIAGPSVYKHFASKQDLLVAAMDRGHARLQQELRNVTAQKGSDEERLRRVSAAYVALTLDNSDLVATLIGESIHLEGPHRQRTREIQRNFINGWVTLLQAHHPDDSATVARIKVQAAQMVTNDIARTPHLRKVPGFRQTVIDVCWALQQ
jgi:AcrR family transcriptional regulator